MGIFGYKRVETDNKINQNNMSNERRKFDTGAVRDSENGKEIYGETISWVAFRRYAQYMTSKRNLYGDGNFKRGLPVSCYEESFCRHLTKYMINKYEGGDLEKDQDHLAAMIFNIFGIMHEEEIAKNKSNSK